MASVKNPTPVRRAPVGNASQAPGARPPNAFERAALAAGLPIARPVPVNVARNPLQGGRRKTRRGGKPPAASLEGNPVVDAYVLLARSPTRESLLQIADDLEDAKEPSDRLDKLQILVSRVRTTVGHPGTDIPRIVELAKDFMSEFLLSGFEKDYIRSQGIEVVEGRIHARRGGRRRKTRKGRKM